MKEPTLLATAELGEYLIHCDSYLGWDGDDLEQVVLAYKTNEIDCWGKRTFYVVMPSGNLEPWYLFAREWSKA